MLKRHAFSLSSARNHVFLQTNSLVSDMSTPEKRVLVGMSGGIDSTATCLMLKEQGYEIVGLTMWVWGDEPVEARNLADSMGIEHHVADEREAFRQIIVQNFIDEYRRGRTPNPCVMCNPLFKFRILTEWADKLGCAYIATGHYTRLEERNGKVYIIAGDDDKKDQSYFLWRLGQELLKRCIFPLGTYTKQQVREYLRDKGYTVKAEEGESMEVCFIKGDYRDFLREHSPEIDREVGPGWFVNSEGVKLGEHKGFPYYTIGQRKGLEIALGKPAYVLKINPQKNTVMLGDAEQLKTEYMLAEQDNLIDEAEVFGNEELTVRIRYRVMGRADSQSKRSRFIGRGQRGRIAIICFNLFIRPRIVPHEMVAVSVAGYEPFVGHAVQGLETGLRFILAVGLYLADLVIDVFLARQSAFEGFAGQALQVVACIGDMVCPRHAVTEPPDGLHDLGLRVYCRKGGTHYIRQQDYMGFVV